MDQTYEEFIQNILATRGRFNCGDEYHERHHIVPKCLGGVNNEENLIDLFAREHFIAHKLLALENPDNDSLVYSWWMMSQGAKREYQYRYELTPEEYEEARIHFCRRSKSEETKRKMSESAIARYMDPKEHKKSSDAQKKRFAIPEEREKLSGENSPMFGKCQSEEAKQKMSKSQKKRLSNPENNPMYGRPWWNESTPQEKINEWKRHLSDAMSGENNPNYGKHLSEETKRKISEAHKGKTQSAESNKKRSEAEKGGKNPNARKVIRLIDEKIYICLNYAAEDNNLCRSSIYKKCKDKKDFMYYNDWIALQNDCENKENINGF